MKLTNNIYTATSQEIPEAGGVPNSIILNEDDGSIVTYDSEGVKSSLPQILYAEKTFTGAEVIAEIKNQTLVVVPGVNGKTIVPLMSTYTKEAGSVAYDFGGLGSDYLTLRYTGGGSAVAEMNVEAQINTLSASNMVLYPKSDTPVYRSIGTNLVLTTSRSTITQGNGDITIGCYYVLV